jgi:hypothetical protein
MQGRHNKHTRHSGQPGTKQGAGDTTWSLTSCSCTGSHVPAPSHKGGTGDIPCQQTPTPCHTGKQGHTHTCSKPFRLCVCRGHYYHSPYLHLLCVLLCFATQAIQQGGSTEPGDWLHSSQSGWTACNHALFPTCCAPPGGKTIPSPCHLIPPLHHFTQSMTSGSAPLVSTSTNPVSTHP